MGPEGATGDLVAELNAGRERLNEIHRTSISRSMLTNGRHF
jgi:hypothetical protein